jgi:4-amino-4-deoxy-L-arabinose transferase-like glycosyltransferase
MFKTMRADSSVLRAGQNFVRKFWPQLIVLALLAVMAANLFAVITRKSITIDEIAHVPAGYYHLVAGNYTLNNEHPPLVKYWAALPLLFLQPNEPPLAALDNVDFYTRTGDAFAKFWTANASQFEVISFWTRVPMIVLTLALGWLIFVFTTELSNPRAGVLAVALYSLEPTVLAHGRIVHTDLPAALAYLLFVLALYRYHRRSSFRSALVLGLVTGVALVTKFSLVIVGPIFAVAMGAWILRAPSRGINRGQIVRHVLVAGLVVLAVINLAYRFQRQPILPGDVAWVAAKTPEYAPAIMSGISALSIFFPTYFLFGLYNTVLHNNAGHASFLLGQYSDTGWWYYFPVAFALKTTLVFLGVALAALLWALWRLFVRHDTKLLFVLGPIGVYVAVSLTSGINIGIRHFLPVYPLLFILAGLLLDRLLGVSKWRYLTGMLVAMVIAMMGLETVRAYPDYVSYVNQLRGDQPGWRLLSDSNVEWGDDVKAVAAYLHAHGETRLSGAVSAGWLTFRFFGVDYFDICPPRQKDPIQTKYVAIGASFLNGSTVPGSAVLPEKERENMFAAYRDRKPEAVFGNSIYLYRVK